MTFAPGEPSSRVPYNTQKKASRRALLIIDANEARAQNLARLLTLIGLRAIVTSTTYQAFDRFLKEHFIPQAILIGQQEEASRTLFVRLFQRLTQELQYEPPVISISSFILNDGLPLIAEVSNSAIMHSLSQQNSAILKNIWKALPSMSIPPGRADKTIVMNSLPQLGFLPRVTHNKRSFSSHLHQQLKAAKQVIPHEQWDTLLTDVGLAQFSQEENWPPLVDQLTTPPENYSLLTQAVMLSNPQQPIEQVYHWASKVEADAIQKALLIFIMQQIPKIIGVDRTMRTLLNVLMNEVDSRRGEKLTEWKRLDDGSFIFVFYSNIFTYGVVGAEQPICSMWQFTFDLILKLAKQRQHWHIREVECSGQTQTGHCVFLISAK